MNVNFKGAAKRLDDVDLPRLGRTIGVGEDEIHAFMDVEASGSGFDASGRVKALFEPHWFHRCLTGANLIRATAKGLAYPRWGTMPYPRDSYMRIHQAMEIDETAALKSTSWGLGQIMGLHYRICGYASPQQMVTAFAADEENHLAAMIEFLRHENIDDDLRAHRWAVVARVYNGPGYAKNRYDEKLAARFAHWQKIRDTPLP